jgi:hypothetical protein
MYIENHKELERPYQFPERVGLTDEKEENQ